MAGHLPTVVAKPKSASNRLACVRWLRTRSALTLGEAVGNLVVVVGNLVFVVETSSFKKCVSKVSQCASFSRQIVSMVVATRKFH